MKYSSLQDRIDMVGKAVFGAEPGWIRRLADGLGMSRSQLHLYRRGVGKIDRERDVDGELVALIERERDASQLRGVALTQLRSRLIKLARAEKAE